VAGLLVEVAAPPVAVIPVNEGIEKNVFSHAAGAVRPMLATLVSVTTSGLLACPLAPTVRGVVSVWEVPLEPVEKFQVTALGVAAKHPVWVADRALLVYPMAYVVLVGNCTAVIVTGYGLRLLIDTTTSPVPPGYNRLVAAGDATAVIVKFAMVADCPSPLEPAPSPTTQFVTA